MSAGTNILDLHVLDMIRALKTSVHKKGRQQPAFAWK
jgi:hypothetical protein